MSERTWAREMRLTLAAAHNNGHAPAPLGQLTALLRLGLLRLSRRGVRSLAIPLLRCALGQQARTLLRSGGGTFLACAGVGEEGVGAFQTRTDVRNVLAQLSDGVHRQAESEQF